MGTKIEWADETWNPVTGCTKISEGCAHCFAKRMAQRLAGRFGYPADDPFRVTIHEDKLDQPCHWPKPRRVFVCSMGDLFHEDVPESWISRVFGVIDQCRKAGDQHTFMILTKRPERMAEYIGKWWENDRHPAPVLSNLWLGVTAENQARADERIPVLLEIPAAVRFVSVEPCLSEVILEPYLSEYDMRPTYTYYRAAYPGMEAKPIRAFHGIDWVICGAETGPGARPMKLDWARSLCDQCAEGGTPFFFKRDSDGNRKLDGRLWEQYPGAVG